MRLGSSVADYIRETEREPSESRSQAPLQTNVSRLPRNIVCERIAGVRWPVRSLFVVAYALRCGHHSIRSNHGDIDHYGKGQPGEASPGCLRREPMTTIERIMGLFQAPI